MLISIATSERRFSIVAIFHEILLGHTDSLGSAPGFVNMILVFLFMAIIGMYEGLQIALCALAHVDVAALRDRSPVAAANCELTFGSNLESFLIGRQMLVTVFVVGIPIPVDLIGVMLILYSLQLHSFLLLERPLFLNPGRPTAITRPSILVMRICKN